MSDQANIESSHEAAPPEILSVEPRRVNFVEPARVTPVGRILDIASTWWPPVGVVVLVASIINARLVVASAIGALSLLQITLVVIVTSRFVGPITTDEHLRERITPILLDLCRECAYAVPTVVMRPGAVMAGVTGHPEHRAGLRLILSPDFVGRSSDAVVRAVLAHEISHVRSEAFHTRQRVVRLVVTGVAVITAALIALHRPVNIVQTCFLIGAFALPVTRMAMWVLGFSWRQHELEADRGALDLTHDRDALVEGLELVYAMVSELRARIYPSALTRLALVPYSLRATTHPTLERRIEALAAT